MHFLTHFSRIKGDELLLLLPILFAQQEIINRAVENVFAVVVLVEK